MRADTIPKIETTKRKAPVPILRIVQDDRMCEDVSTHLLEAQLIEGTDYFEFGRCEE